MLGLWLALLLATEPETAEVRLEAERLLHDGQQDLTTAEGRAKLFTEGSAVDADRIVFDKKKRVATATGHVVARLSQGGKVAVLADLVTLRFDDANEVSEIFLFDGQALSKKDVPLELFLAADTPERVQRAGTTQALLSGNHLVRAGRSAWTVEQLDLVPCECDFSKPSWSISSSSATVDTEAERVSITNPVVRIKQVPVLWLPWLSLPLTDRQTGLLFTKPDYTPLNGFSLFQPVFVTLGRSADLTLTPGFFTGAKGPTGVAGPKLTTELRYAPSTRASGRAVLGLLYDLREKRDVETAVRRAGTVRGWRGELSWQHTQDFDHGFGVRVDLNGHSDGDYNRDNTIDVIASTVTYLRSSATAFHRGADHFIGLDVGLRQDIQWGYDWLGDGTIEPGKVVGPWGPGTLQRLPVVTFGWAPSSSLGPLRFSVEGEAARLAPLFSLTGDEGRAAHEGAIEPTTFAVAVNRLFSPNTVAAPELPRNGVGNRTWEPGEREARDRLMLLPRLSFATQPLGALSISASAGWRQLAWLGEASGRSWSRGYLLLGGAVETELSRRFGALRHALQPRVELRAVPFGYDAGTSGVAPVPYDPIDFAVPDTAARVQGVVELRQRLVGAGGVEHLRLDLGQGLEWSATRQARVAESYGRLVGRVGWVTVQGALRLDPLTPADPITRLYGRVDLDDGRGHGAYGAYENVLLEGTARTRQPIDLLFLIDRGFTSTTRVRQVTFGARWDFGPVALRYDALVAEQVLLADRADPKIAVGPATLAMTQHTLGVGLSPACDCWRVDVWATQNLFDGGKGTPVFPAPSFGFNVTVSRFGSIR